MKKKLIACLTVLPVLASLGGCGLEVDEGTGVGSTEAKLLGQDQHLYLRCNATGWDVNDRTRLVQASPPESFTLTYDVSQPWMVTNGDSCSFTLTNQLNGWGTTQTSYDLRGSDLLVVPQSGPAYGQLTQASSSQFAVKYPSVGRYKATVNWSNGAFRIEPVRDERFSVIVGVHEAVCQGLAAEFGPHCENLGALSARVRQEFEAVNHAFNDPGVFAQPIHFDATTVYSFAGDPLAERGKPHPDHDVRMVMSISPERSFMTFDNAVSIFGNNASDALGSTVTITHELAHILRAYDIYGVGGWDTWPHQNIMSTGGKDMPDLPYWHAATVRVINDYIASNDRPSFPFGELTAEYMPDVVKVVARDRSGALWANAPIEVYGMTATFTLVDGTTLPEPVFRGTTNAAGEFTLPRDPYVDAADPARLAYSDFLAIMSTHGPDGLEVGRVILPIYDAQLAAFEGRDYTVELQAALVQRGDVLANGSVSSPDALALAKYLEGDPIHPSFPEVGDANCDGVIDQGDPLAIVQMAAGIHPSGCP